MSQVIPDSWTCGMQVQLLLFGGVFFGLVVARGRDALPAAHRQGARYCRWVRDLDIRRVLDEQLTFKYAGRVDTVIRHELGVDAGRRRVDVALVNGHLDGWEIKSDRDTLARLPAQVEGFSRVLDRSWLVTTDRHLPAALDVLPPWWGLIRATAPRGSVRLRQLRRPSFSPMLDAMSIAQLLWREEAMTVLRGRNLAHGLSGRARWYVWERMAESLSLKEIQVAVRDALRARPDWPGGQPPS